MKKLKDEKEENSSSLVDQKFKKIPEHRAQKLKNKQIPEHCASTKPINTRKIKYSTSARS